MPLTSLTPSQRQDDKTSKKFVPRRRPDVQQLASSPPPTSVRELKAKIVGALGDYRIAHGDLIALYGLSHAEARHAVGQLQRLLWGRQDMDGTAARLDQYLAWKKEFSSVLRRAVATRSVQEEISVTTDARLDAAAYETETASMRTVWERMDRDRRERLWPQMVLSALVAEPHILPALIQTTFDPSWCPSYVIEDILYLLFRRYQIELDKAAPGSCGKMQHDIQALGHLILEKCPPRYLALEQTVLLLISSSLSTSELLQFYRLLQNIEHPLHANTLLHFAGRFAKGYDTKVDAVDILHTVTQMSRFDLNTPAAASVCTSLLTLKENEPLPDQHAAPDLLFEFLLERGFRPNLLGLSAMMRNFCIRGHFDTAWKIFDLMLQHGLEPDHHVYSILLNGAKKNLDSASVERIFQIIRSRNAWSTVLVNDFLDLLFRENESQLEQRRRQRKKVNNAWRPMFQLYAKFYELGPLQNFTLFPLENLLATWSVKPQYSTRLTRMVANLRPQPKSRLMQPESITLCLMIGAHMRSIYSPKHVVRYYNHFFNLVRRKDPMAMSLLADQGTIMHDIFLRALLQFRETVGFAIRHVQKMINAASKEQVQRGRIVYHHYPSTHTWTILLNGLKNHNDTRGAIGVLNMMNNIGHTKPTLATWNALIQALARAKNVDGVVKAIWSLEKAGFQPNEKTIKAVHMFPRHLREQAIAQLEEIRKSPDVSWGPKAQGHGSIAKPSASKIRGEYDLSTNDPIQRPQPRIASTLEELAMQQEKWHLERIEARSRRQQWDRQSRVSNQFNSSRPLGVLAGDINLRRNGF
jgi:pentatricopeptide repeat protein